MATTFAEAEVRILESAQDIVRHRQALTNAINSIQQVEGFLAAMPAKYGTVYTDITSAAAANPTNQALQDLKRRRDMLESEFLTLRTKAQELLAAVTVIVF